MGRDEMRLDRVRLNLLPNIKTDRESCSHRLHLCGVGARRDETLFDIS